MYLKAALPSTVSEGKEISTEQRQFGVYRNGAEARKAVKFYRTIVAALVEREPEAAAEWLKRDANRSTQAAEEFERRAKDVEDQINLFTGRKVGDCPQSKKLRSLAYASHEAAQELIRASGSVNMDPAEVNARLAHAIEAVNEKKLEAQAEKEKKAAKIDPVQVAA